MRITVDTSSPMPAYEQVRAQVEFLVRTGELAAGTRLPPIRQLAHDLELAPGTIARAYRLLEAQGLATAAGRRGTVVSSGVATSTGRRRGELDRAADTFARTVRALGVDAATARRAVLAALDSVAAETG